MAKMSAVEQLTTSRAGEVCLGLRSSAYVLRPIVAAILYHKPWLNSFAMLQAHAWRAWREGILLQAARRADVEQAISFWRKHELLSAFRSWQDWTGQRQELKRVAGLVVGRMCMSSQVSF